VEDRALVAALVEGDPRGLEGAYRGYADRLYTFCRGMLRDPDAAADAVHDTFILASQRASQLRDPDRLRPWLYAIARNECLRLLRVRARHAPLEEAGEVSAPETDPVTGLRAAEIQELVWAAAEGLGPGDWEVFELTVRHDLPAPEVAELLGISVAHAHARLSRARAQLERSLGALLVARTGTQDCPELAELLRGWDGKLTVLVRKRVSRHVESCETCGERRRRQLRPAAFFSAYASAPLLLAPAELWPRLELTGFDPGHAGAREAIVRRAGRFDPETGFPRPLDLARRRVAVAGVAAAALLLLGAGAGAAALIPPPEPAPPAAEVMLPDQLPTLPVLTSPTPSPTPTLSPTPTATALPAPPPATGPPVAPPPTSDPPPTEAPPLRVLAEACLVARNGVVANLTANQPIDSPILFVESEFSSVPPEPIVMSLTSPTTATSELTLESPGLHWWWVEVTAGDQRYESPRETVQACTS
jgi:RNA polymerase sigma factor (sigma-70 family)